MQQFLAVYTGKPMSPEDMAAVTPETIQKGLGAWHGWMEKHADKVIVTGGPLGKTKRVGPDGITDVRNQMSGFIVIEADSHEAAAALFEGHPHFTIFPGDGVDVMPVMPVPGM